MTILNKQPCMNKKHKTNVGFQLKCLVLCRQCIYLTTGSVFVLSSIFNIFSQILKGFTCASSGWGLSVCVIHWPWRSGRCGARPPSGRCRCTRAVSWGTETRRCTLESRPLVWPSPECPHSSPSEEDDWNHCRTHDPANVTCRTLLLL